MLTMQKLAKKDRKFAGLLKASNLSSRRLYRLSEKLRIEAVRYRRTHDKVTAYFKEKYYDKG